MSKISDQLRKKIDAWIKDHKRNEFGDREDTMYAGGTPLFDERSGTYKDRYEYILERNPGLREKLQGEQGQEC